MKKQILGLRRIGQDKSMNHDYNWAACIWFGIRSYIDYTEYDGIRAYLGWMN